MKRCWPAASRSPRPVSPTGVTGFSRDVPKIFAAKVPLFPYFGVVAAIMSHSLPGEPRQGSSAPATFRVELSDGLGTTVHLAAYDLRQTEVRVVALPQAEPLAAWCARSDVAEALVGGFFVRESAQPLGELRLGGIPWASVPFMAPWNAVRSCVHVEGGALRIARRQHLPLVPRGDLLQAGPLLVEQGHAGGPRRRRPRGLFGRLRAVRLGHHRGAPSARGARGEGRHRPVADLRRPQRCRRRPHSRRAGRADGGARRAAGDQPRRRRVGDPAVRRADRQPAAGARRHRHSGWPPDLHGA